MNDAIKPQNGVFTVPAIISIPHPTPQPSEAAIKPPFHRQWNSNICDCCIDCGSCFKSFICPCCSFYSVKKNVDGDKGFCSNCCCAVCCCLLPFSVCIRAPYRKKLRVKYNLPAKPCNDCCTTFWCPCCALAQEMREIEYQVKTKPAFQNMK
jgi:Cys-rich protein (TIGR01571 family)